MFDSFKQYIIRAFEVGQNYATERPQSFGYYGPVSKCYGKKSENNGAYFPNVVPSHEITSLFSGGFKDLSKNIFVP